MGASLGARLSRVESLLAARGIGFDREPTYVALPVKDGEPYPDGSVLVLEGGTSRSYVVAPEERYKHPEVWDGLSDEERRELAKRNAAWIVERHGAPGFPSTERLYLAARAYLGMPDGQEPHSRELPHARRTG